MRKTALWTAAIALAALIAVPAAQVASHGRETGQGMMMAPGQGAGQEQAGRYGPRGDGGVWHPPGMMMPGAGMGTMSPGYGHHMSPGMMGPGYGHHMSPGYGYHMGPGYGYHTGPGMMGPGYGRHMMPGYGYHMAPGMMVPGTGMGMMGRGLGGPAEPLSADQARTVVKAHLIWRGHGDLDVGEVSETENDTLEVEIVDAEGSAVRRLEIDPQSGWFRPLH